LKRPKELDRQAQIRVLRRNKDLRGKPVQQITVERAYQQTSIAPDGRLQNNLLGIKGLSINQKGRGPQINL